MRYKTLFRVMQKVVGLFIAVNGFISSISFGVAFITDYWRNENTGSVTWFYNFWSLAQGGLSVAVGLYLFFGGRWIADLAIPGNRPYCHECGYDLTKNTEGKCPECGTAMTNEQRRDPM